MSVCATIVHKICAMFSDAVVKYHNGYRKLKLDGPAYPVKKHTFPKTWRLYIYIYIYGLNSINGRH